MSKMNEETLRSKEKEIQLMDEIEKLKKKVQNPTQISLTNLKQTKGKHFINIFN